MFPYQGLFTVIHSAVFTGHLVYVCVVVALIFRNDNLLIMRQELTPLIKKNPWVYYRNIWENIIRWHKHNVWPLKLRRHIIIWRELAKNKKNNVYKNGDKIAIFLAFWKINISKLCHRILIFFFSRVTCNSQAFNWDYICFTYIF